MIDMLIVDSRTIGTRVGGRACRSAPFAAVARLNIRRVEAEQIAKIHLECNHEAENRLRIQAEVVTHWFGYSVTTSAISDD